MLLKKMKKYEEKNDYNIKKKYHINIRIYIRLDFRL